MKRHSSTAPLILVVLTVLVAFCGMPALARAETSEARTKAMERAVGAVLLSVGAVMLPVSTAWYLTAPGTSLCFDGCDAETEHRNRVAFGAFGGWHAGANAMAAAGAAVLVAGQHDGGAPGPRHRHARTMRIVGGVLVAASAIVLPIGVVGINADLGSPLGHDGERALGAGITALGSAMLTAGTALTATGAYYDSRPASPQLSIRPTSRPTGGQAGWDGAVATLSGRF